MNPGFTTGVISSVLAIFHQKVTRQAYVYRIYQVKNCVLDVQSFEALVFDRFESDHINNSRCALLSADFFWTKTGVKKKKEKKEKTGLGVNK